MHITKDRLIALLMISPSLLLLAVFIYGFIAQTALTSVSDWGGAAALSETRTGSFVFLKNYTDLFTSLLNIRFRMDLVNTVMFTVLFIGGCLFLGLAMALLLDQKIRGEGLFRTIFLFPMALSFVVTGTVWRWLFAPKGGINVLPTVAGLPALNFEWFTDRTKIISFTWQEGLICVAIILMLVMFYIVSQKGALGSKLVWLIPIGLLAGLIFGGAFGLPPTIAAEKHGFNAAMIAIVIAAVWQMSGYTMAIYLAGLRGIPEELREAALVDGCNDWQVYRYVIFPMLRPITLSAAIILGHISLKIFDLIYVMAGSVNLLVTVPGINMHLTAFNGNNFASGSAIAIIMLLLVAVLIIPYLISQLREGRQG
jgi:glucose/mannose transport system permease protein